MPPRKISRLTKIKFSELSAVDRPANDHATLESAEMMKRYGFNVAPMPKADEVGDLPQELQTPEAKPLLKRFVSWLFDKREVSTEERESLASEGKALPHGGYPIASVGDLKNAIQAIGRAKDPAATKAHIKRRAAALGRTDLIPEQWKIAESEWHAKIDGDRVALGIEIASELTKKKAKVKLPQTEADLRPPGTHPGKAGNMRSSVKLVKPGVKPKVTQHSGAKASSAARAKLFTTMDLDKSFATISQLSEFVWQLTGMCKQLEVEGALEGDEEPVGKELEKVRDELADLLVELCEHEVSEVKSGTEVGQSGVGMAVE